MMLASPVSCGTSLAGENNELGISDWLITISNGEEWKRVSFGLQVSALVSSQVLDRRKRRPLPKSSLSLFIGFEDEWWVRKRCERDEIWMELKTSAELVNKVPDSEKYGEFP
ncbi:hypothetical protein Bca4012_007139 [Brassica carinata]|uniref:Uncharacterized protein n=1 Tax=Brassica carinata TaxID=52824 RepID=A0A8X7RNL7_BRACI|nr:hypothetical protein Bca52824_037856 [Brassica carinata]